MVDKVKYTTMLNNELRGLFSEETQSQIGMIVTFLGGLERELGNKNQLIVSQIHGCFNFKASNTVEDLICSLKSFLQKNEQLVWVEDNFRYLDQLTDQEVFQRVRDLCCRVSWKDTPLETFKYYLEDSRLSSTAGVTAQSLCELACELLSRTSFKTIYDPTIGTGTLINEVVKGHEAVEVFGQEMSQESLNYCRMLFVLSGRNQDLSNLKQGNVLMDPKHIAGHEMQTFDCVVCDPPIGLREWSHEGINEDPRFHRGVPPHRIGDFAFVTQAVESLNAQGKALMILPPGVLFRAGREGEIRKQLVPPHRIGDFAFVTQAVESLNAQGKALMILPPGVLFRAGREGEIRKQLIEENVIETIIALPRNMLTSAIIPVNIVIFNKGKKTEDIQFIDASSFAKRRRYLNILTRESIHEIATIYHNREEREMLSRLVPLSEVRENQYNLLIERYLTPPLVVETYSRDELKQEQQELQKQLSRLVPLSEVRENQYNLLIERYLTPPLVVETYSRDELKQEQQELQKQLLNIQSQLEEILG